MKITTPECSHFGSCGGCLYQNIPYEEQVVQKEEKLKETLGVAVSVTPSPISYNYRNRMDFVSAFGKIGFRVRGQYKTVVDLKECHLLPQRFLPLFLKLKEAVVEYNIPQYDYLKHKGYLRYIVFRVAANTDDLLVSFVTATEEELIKPLIVIAKEEATSVNWLVHEGVSDLSSGRVYKTYNKDHITEKIGDIVYKIGANTFFQNNGFLCNQLFDEVRKNVEGRVLDLFCGTGAISLYVADKAESVFGVELVQESIEMAEENCLTNNISNCRFLTANVAEWIKTEAGLSNYDTIIVDPPRIGLGGKICRRISRLNMKKIIYVSCNPSTLRDDIAFLGDNFELTSIKGFDMFPQTPHIECVAVLKKIEKKPSSLIA